MIKQAPHTKNKAVYYTSIHKLPYPSFKEIMIEGDLNLLVISGDASNNELESIWEDLLTQYGDAIGQNDPDGYYMAYRAYLRALRNKDKTVTLISLLKEIYYKKWADELNLLLSSNFAFDPYNKEEYLKHLKKCESRAKEKQIKVELAESLVKKIEAERNKNGEASLRPTREYFTTIEHNIEDLAGRQIDWEKISAYQFCDRVLRYNEHIDFLKKQNLKK